VQRIRAPWQNFDPRGKVGLLTASLREVLALHAHPGRDFQRKAFNTEAKLLMLAHAFERVDCIRVELRADVLNNKSRNAIARLGAKQEGILRHHMILPDGRLIDWVYYSILRDEWTAVRADLEHKLASHERG
jgi:RimJ/RimL family protein N-acetyltransferase